MFLARIVALLILLTGAPLCLAGDNSSASSTDSNSTAAGHNGEEHHGLTPDAPVLTKIGPFPVNNSMIVIWIVALGIIITAQAATRNVKLIPSGLQNFVELLVESLYGFFESILGNQMAKQTFWFFGTIFIFILATNWFGLLPGLGSVGFGVGPDGHVHKPLLRGANADVNMTMAMAAMFMVLWLYWSIKAIGVGGVAGHIFNVKGHGAGFFGVFLIIVFIFVGLIEIVSIGVRPVALTFRLYGNIFAGENILETMIKLGNDIVPFFGGAVAVLPFYCLEILVGLVQALVFALLTSVFTALMCEHHDKEHARD